MNQRAEQPWLWGTRATHPAFRAMEVEWPDGGRGVWRAKDRGLEHIPGPMIADRQPERIAVQPQQHERGSTRQHPQHLLRIQAVIKRKPWDQHRHRFPLPKRFAHYLEPI